MKNTYKWRANSYKYVYIEDAVYSANTENGYVTKGAFLYNKQTGIKIYGRNSDNTLITSTDKVEESLIANVVKGITDGNTYTDLFNRMKSLVDECGDSDYANIKFHDVNEYFNIDGEECAENRPPEPCACYEPKINASVVIEDSDYTGQYIINKGSVTNHTDKVVITNFEFHIPRGKDGAGGNGGGIGPQGPQGPQGKPGDVINVIDCTYTTGETGECSVNLTDNVYNHPSGYTEHDLTFDFHLIRGKQGPQGDPGDDGNDGYDSKIGIVTASANTIDSNDNASVTVTSAITRYDTSRQFITDLDFVFDIPKGEQGEQGEQGPPPKISGVTLDVFQLNDDSKPEGSVEFQEVSVPYYNEEDLLVYTETQYILHFKLWIPKGLKGDKGDTGLPGEKGATEYFYINESGFTNDDNGGGNNNGIIYDFNDVYWCGDDTKMPVPIGNFITKPKGDGTTSVDICLTPNFFNNGEDGGIDLEEGDVYLCGTDKPIGDVKFVKTEDNGNEYKINVCINEEYLRGGLLYCEGSGITFTEGDDDNCTMINSNTESYTVSAITCSTGAPVEALGIWDGDVIPSGTTVQEILEKLLCREVFPAAATKPSIMLSKGSPTLTTLYEVGEEITLPNIGMTKNNGKFNPGSTKRTQPSVIGVTWSNEEISPRITDGFSTFTPISGTTSISSVSKVVVDLGLNKIEYDGSADYSKPSNMPITNLGNSTQSTKKVSTDGSDISAIWADSAATDNIITQVTGVYPVFVNLNSSKTSYINSILSGGTETANFLKLPLTAGSSITFDMISENTIHLIVDFPEFYDGSKIRILNNLFNGGEGFLIEDMSSGKKENDYFVQFTGSYKVSSGIKHDINGNLYNYKRMELTGDPIGANKLKFNFNASLNR